MDKIQKYIVEIKTFITIAKLSYDAWWSLAGEKSKKFESIQKKFPTHFEISKHAYLNTLIVTLYMTLENRKETINIRQLVKLIKKNRKFSPADLILIEKDIESAKTIWKKISILRSNQFAHFNYQLSLSGVFKKANIMPVEFKEYISQLESILNKVSHIYNGSVHAFNIDNKYSTKQFMDSLNSHNNRFNPTS